MKDCKIGDPPVRAIRVPWCVTHDQTESRCWVDICAEALRLLDQAKQTLSRTQTSAGEDTLERKLERVMKERDEAILRVDALQAVAEAAREALGCCDFGCQQLSGCDHKNCCPKDAKVIAALNAVGSSGIGPHKTREVYAAFCSRNCPVGCLPETLEAVFATEEGARAWINTQKNPERFHVETCVVQEK